MLLWLYDGSTISIYRVFNRIGCRLWVRYKGLLRCPHTPGVQMPAELGHLYFMSIEAWKCPYSIIRTNRKSFAAQRVDWLITIPQNPPKRFVSLCSVQGGYPLRCFIAIPLTLSHRLLPAGNAKHGATLSSVFDGTQGGRSGFREAPTSCMGIPKTIFPCHTYIY